MNQEDKKPAKRQIHCVRCEQAAHTRWMQTEVNQIDKKRIELIAKINKGLADPRITPEQKEKLLIHKEELLGQNKTLSPNT